MQTHSPEEIVNFQNIVDKYDLYFVDLWGVIHNGIKLFSNAIEVLNNLKNNNKKVILISNAPRTHETVKKFLKNLDFDLKLIDSLVTSGDVTKKYIQDNQDKKFCHLGPPKDNDLFQGVANLVDQKDEFDEIICTGLIDGIGQNISDYQRLFENWIGNKKIFICANPDEVVSRGDKIEFCAGALAKYYKKMGGEVKYFGKPYEAIYDFAYNQTQSQFDTVINKNKILAVGDNLKTDINGAQNFGIHSILILNGIYKDFFRDNNLNFDKLLISNEVESLVIDKFQKELKW